MNHGHPQIYDAVERRVPREMSVREKEARPGRCCCRARDEAASLNDIAKIIAALNHKILGLRNEVNAFENVGGEKKSLVGKNKRGHLLAACYETESGAQPIISGTAVTHVVPFRSNSMVDYKLQRERIYAVPCRDLISKEFSKIGRKISRATQCDLTMRRRIRDVFNCFNIASIIGEKRFWKRSKEVVEWKKKNNRVSFDPDPEEMFGTVEQDSEDDESLRTDFEEDLDRTIDWTLESVKTEQKKGKGTLKRMQENKTVGIDLDEDRNRLQKDKGEDSEFEYSVTGRMSGGAEFRGNRLISELGEKIQKICLYKTVKFDAKNVKRRLDACIAELNEIIDDIILIFSDRNASTI